MTNKEAYFDEIIDDAIYDNICGFIIGTVLQEDDCDGHCRECGIALREWLEKEKL